MDNPTEQALRGIPLLSNLEDRELRELAQVAELRQVKKGERILRAEERGHFIMFLVSGQLHVLLMSDEGREALLDILRPGEFFGELALLSGRRRSANVDAAEDSAILVLSQQVFETHIINHKGLVRALLRDLACRLHDTTTKTANLLMHNVYRRLAKELTSLAVSKPGEAGPVLVIEHRPTHKELAAMVGTTREMVTRALKKLEADGFLRVEGSKITILQSP